MRKVLAVLCSLFLWTSIQAGKALVIQEERAITNHEQYDLFNVERKKQSSCQIVNGYTVSENLKCSSGTDEAVLVVTRGSESVASITHHGSCGMEYTLACDLEKPQFYFGHPWKGTLHAYDANGGELWKQSIPHYVADNGYLAIVESKAGYVMVETKTKGLGMYHTVYTSAGELVEQIGPWDGMMRFSSEPDTWSLFAGGGIEYNNYLPDTLLDLSVADRTEDAILARVSLDRLSSEGASFQFDHARITDSTESVKWHMIAFMTFTRIQREPHLDICPGIEDSRAAYWLGKSFNKKDAYVARRTMFINVLGSGSQNMSSWFDRLAEREPLKSVLERFDPTSDGWINEYQAALYEVANEQFIAWLKPLENEAK